MSSERFLLPLRLLAFALCVITALPGRSPAVEEDAATRADAVVEEESAAGADAAEAPADAVEAPPAGSSAIQTLGDAITLSLVDHDGTWSMHVENVTSDELFHLWRTAGGPEVVVKMLVDRPVTVSVHRMTPERIVERLLIGYGYTLHYDADGRLARVRVYSPTAQSNYKLARLTESLAKWREAESAAAPVAKQSRHWKP